MHSLEVLQALNLRAQRAFDDRRKRPAWPEYGYTGDAKRGVHMRRQQTLLTFFLRPGPEADDFLRRVRRLRSDAGRDRLMRSYFPHAV